MSDSPPTLRLRIEPIVERAEQHAAAVQRNLPGHDGILAAARGVAAAAHEAERVSRRLRRPLGFHRLPALFLGVALALFVAWCYWYFFHVSRLSIALPDRDAIELRERISRGQRVRFREVRVPGSHEAASLVTRGQVDLAFVQGGIDFPDDLQRLEMPRPEAVLFFLRDGIEGPRHVRRILTSVENEGSHRVAQDFVAAWGLEGQASFLHDWTHLAGSDDYAIPRDVDAVFVVKDPSDEPTWRAVQRLTAAGFRLASPELGARALRLDYLREATLAAGYLSVDPPLPDQPVSTYHVPTYLVARRGLTPRLLGMAAHLLEQKAALISDAGFEPNVESTSEALQGGEAFLGILVYIGLAFLALLGLDVMTYRRRFSDLDALVSLISMLQSSKDVLGVSDPRRRADNLLYLSTCSDLLGLISVIAGYYSQENASLLYNNLLGIIHDRSSSLKLNIQLKILHASLDVAPHEEPAASDCPPPPAASPSAAL